MSTFTEYEDPVFKTTSGFCKPASRAWRDTSAPHRLHLWWAFALLLPLFGCIMPFIWRTGDKNCHDDVAEQRWRFFFFLKPTCRLAHLLTHHWNENIGVTVKDYIKHPNNRNTILEYRFFFFFFDFFFSRRGDGERLSELTDWKEGSKLLSFHEHTTKYIHFLTCLCSYFSFSFSDCASLGENQNPLNLPTIWGSKGVGVQVKAERLI